MNKNDFKATKVSVNSNPLMPDFKGSHYQVTIKCLVTGKSITTPFSMGSGLSKSDFSPEMVLNSLQGEYFTDSFHDFCGDFGYDENDKDSKRIYRNIQKQTKKIAAMLNNDETLIDDFLYNSEF